MRVLVTGGAGFIGSHIVDRLIADGYQVTVVDNLSTGLIKNVHPAAEFVRMDIEVEDIRLLFARKQFDYVVHQAAQTMVSASFKHPDADCRVNVTGLVNVLEACRHTGVKKFLFASSAAIYGDVAKLPVTEDTLPNPASFYGLSKWAGERYIDLYARTYGFTAVILRYANVYGERQGEGGEGGVVSIFSRKLAEGKPLAIYGDGGQTRDFVYVGDVAAANIRALTSDTANGVYHVSTHSEISVNGIVDAFEAIVGQPVEKVYQEARRGDIYRSVLSNEKALQELGWQPATQLIEGLRRTYEDFLCRLDNQT